MVAFAGKRILIVGPERGLLATVAEELGAGNTPLTFLPEQRIDWTDASALEALFDSHSPSVLLTQVDLSDPALRAGDRVLQRNLIQRNQMLAELCARQACIPILLSDYHVFGGDTKNAYDEADPPAPLDSFGEFMAELEQQYAATVEKHLILRFSWLIDATGNNLFTRILGALLCGEELVLSRYRRGAPTWYSDARRVICGVVRQVLSGAENWGCFHYCSADSCNEWEFGQEVEATLSEVHGLNGKIRAGDEKDSDTRPSEPASATLNSRRIRNNFGVHGRSWRQGLKAQINQWLDLQDEKERLCSSAS